MNEKIGIIGGGKMGVGIGQLFASKGHEVKILYVGNDKERGDSASNMEANLNFLASQDVIAREEIPAIMARVSYTENMQDIADFADIVFEAIVANLAVKQEMFQKLDSICPVSTVLASNTSALSITLIGEKAEHKERIIGTHFWNPAYLIPLVEVVKTVHVSEETVSKTYNALQEAGKHPVIVEKDVPGFLANRLQHCLFREAISIVEHGIASPAAVDEAIKYGFGMRVGIMAPFEVMDSCGLDMTKAIHEFVFPDIEDTHKVQKLITDNIAAGRLGFKTGGHGIQDWTEEQMKESTEQLNVKLVKVAKALGRI